MPQSPIHAVAIPQAINPQTGMSHRRAISPEDMPDPRHRTVQDLVRKIHPDLTRLRNAQRAARGLPHLAQRGAKPGRGGGFGLPLTEDSQKDAGRKRGRCRNLSRSAGTSTLP